MSEVNPPLPQETSTFETGSLDATDGISIEDFARLHNMELKDVGQQITMRPIVATFFAILLLYQTIAIYTMVVIALDSDNMFKLQPIFAVLVGGTLVQSYKISQLIVNKLFEQIDYKDKHERFKK